jgi:hypothetical protein
MTIDRHKGTPKTTLADRLTGSISISQEQFIATGATKFLLWGISGWCRTSRV